MTKHPTSAWTAQQIGEAFADWAAPPYLIRDRDGVYGNDFYLKIASLGFVIRNARYLKKTVAL